MDKKNWEKCVEFHGHECPGLALGYKVCEAAMEKLRLHFSKNEEIVCVTENDACGVDAVQVLTGCSLGKGNLIYRDGGKQAFTFFNRSTGEKVRIILKPLVWPEEKRKKQELILETPVAELFDFKEPGFVLPEQARIFTTIICEECGEGTMEPKIRIKEGKRVCLDCFHDYSRGW